jgi:hypothetical protein
MTMNPRHAGEASTSRDGDGRGRGSSVTRKVLIGATLVLVLSCSAVAVALEVLVDADDLAAWVAPRASAALNRDVTVGEASLVLLPWPGVRISDVRVANPSRFSEQPLLRSENLWMDVALLPLLVGQVRVRGMRARDVSLHLVIDEEGVSNFGDLVPERRESQTPPGQVRLALRKLAVSEASVTYADAREGRAVELSGASMAARLSSDGSGGWRMRADALSDTLVLRWLDGSRDAVRSPGPAASWTLHGDGVFDRVEIGEGLLTHGGETLAVEGRVTGLRGPAPELDLRLSNDALSAAAMTSWIPDSLRAALGHGPDGVVRPLAPDGTVDVALSFLLPDPRSGRPTLRGRIGLGGVGLEIGDRRIAEDLRGFIEFGPDTLTLNGIGGRFAEGAFELYGRMTGPERAMRMELTARPDLAALRDLGWMPWAGGLSGRASLDVAIEGSASVPDDLRVSGRSGLEGVRAQHPRLGVPIYIPEGEITFDGREARWADLVMMTGVDRVETTGTLHGLALPFTGPHPGTSEGRRGPPVLAATVHASSLDVDALLGRPDERDDVPYPQIVFARLEEGGPGSAARASGALDDPLGRPTHFPVRGTIDISLDSLELRPWSLDSVTARLVLSDSALSVLDASFGIWGGRSTGSLRLGVGDRPAEPFAFDLALDDVAAAPFFTTLTPIGPAISGTLDLELALEGTLDRAMMPPGEALRGSGTLVIREGRVARTGMNHAVADFLSADAWIDLAFDEWTAGFDLREGLFEIPWSELSGALGRATLSGFIALRGGVDLALGLTIPPEELRNISLRRTGVASEVLSRLESAGSPLELGVRATGPLEGPTLEPDGSVAFTRVRPE